MDSAEFYDFDYAFRINGDNLFVVPEILDDMVGSLSEENYDFISNVYGRTFHMV